VEWRSQEGWIGAHKRWRRQHSSFKMWRRRRVFRNSGMECWLSSHRKYLSRLGAQAMSSTTATFIEQRGGYS